MRICNADCLNILVRSVADGGTGYPEWIVAQFSNHFLSSSEILELSNNSGLSTIDWVDNDTVKKVLEWMDGKTFNGVTIAKWEDLVITEEYIEGTRGLKTIPEQPQKDLRKRTRSKKEA